MGDGTAVSLKRSGFAMGTSPNEAISALCVTTKTVKFKEAAVSGPFPARLVTRSRMGDPEAGPVAVLYEKLE